jgi:hypothetical protein
MANEDEKFEKIDNGMPRTDLLDAVTDALVAGTSLGMGVSKEELALVLGKINSDRKYVALHPNALDVMKGDLLEQFANDDEAKRMIEVSFSGERD